MRGAQAGVYSIPQSAASVPHNYLPGFNTSFEDLDARDANNQPITTVSAVNELREIFQDGLFRLLVLSELPSMAQTLRRISHALNLAAHAWGRCLPLPQHPQLLAVLSRPWEYATPQLFRLFGGAILVVSLTFFVLPFVLTKTTAAPLVFRC